VQVWATTRAFRQVLESPDSDSSKTLECDCAVGQICCCVEDRLLLVHRRVLAWESFLP
jgi:hypothetical protein